ncbi:hypothetical protein [Cyanobium gracile]|uniref:hypothetical protein n=1 Tax=Cyanobium gracile TaxID=59930 RepID=UPI00031DD1D6|nr:hypothetical protein [Cyanobium gracile]
MDLTSRGLRSLTQPGRSDGSLALTAAERVLAAELHNRSDDNNALSMMVSSMARMVQVGKMRDSRWKAS